MQKDCKKEAKDFDNAVHEMAYTIGQVQPHQRHSLFRKTRGGAGLHLTEALAYRHLNANIA